MNLLRCRRLKYTQVGHVKTPNKALFWPQIQYKYALSQPIDFISPNSSLENFIPQQIFGSFYTKYNATKINSYAVSSNSLRYIIDKKNHTINYTTPIIWSPLGCLPSLSSAIIIPYRKREQHLRVLTDHLHGFLRHQRIPYTIFIIEQDLSFEFCLEHERRAYYLCYHCQSISKSKQVLLMKRFQIKRILYEN
ncbi:unnamed protein product [Schistosoma margrebowiei]|uniref:Galactosyltransferase N-terminal domain-containing protein n=1 Tax=Schistosoma margrebowiei TaxID=48269 RepID=A0AA84Z8A8_9TREM|nr:unnamed protein product [Schistosoma margrebowiei]